jgi:hypothetical protein
MNSIALLIRLIGVHNRRARHNTAAVAAASALASFVESGMKLRTRRSDVMTSVVRMTSCASCCAAAVRIAVISAYVQPPSIMASTVRAVRGVPALNGSSIAREYSYAVFHWALRSQACSPHTNSKPKTQCARPSTCC